MIIRLPSNDYECFKYPAGEMQVRFSAEMAAKVTSAKSVSIWAQIISAHDIITLCHLADLVRDLRRDTAKLILPYLPYSRADRRFTAADCFGLKVFGNIVDSLGFEQVITLDVHSYRARQLVANLNNVSPQLLIIQAMKEINSSHGAVAFVLPDEGASSRYAIPGSLTCSKYRSKESGILSNFKVPPREAFAGTQAALIVDDICDGGRTFIGIAQEMKEYGLDLYLYVSHGIFSNGTTELNKHFKRIFTSNSFTSTHAGVTRMNCEPLLLEAANEEAIEEVARR